MTTLDLHRSLPTTGALDRPKGRIGTLRRAGPRGLAALRTALVLAARRVGRFAVRPGPLRVALLGIGVCVATGVAIGLAVGQVATRVVEVLLGFAAGP
jgi:hypothetical protein